jgi:transposase
LNYIGIDIAKRKHDCAIINTDGEVLLTRFSFENSDEGFRRLLEEFSSLGAGAEKSVIGMEATGHYWLALYAHLTAEGFTVHVINPIQTDAYRKLSVRKTKNDTIDALAIAKFLRLGDYVPSQAASEDMVGLKNLARYRMYLVSTISDCKRKTIALLDQVFPEYEKIFADMFGESSKALLKECQTPEDVLAISTKKLGNVLNRASRGRFDSNKARQIKAVAQRSFGVGYALDAFSLQIRQLIEQIEFLEKQVDELDKEIAALLKRSNTYVTTIPGIGTTLGAMIVSEIGDVARFNGPQKLVAFAGLDPSVYQSGEFTGTQGHLSKRGSPYLRYAVWSAAERARIYDPILKEHYESKIAQGKHHSVAISSVARKLCNIIYVILKENRPYEVRQLA